MNQKLDYTFCGNCSKTDGCVYTSYPPKVRCTITGDYYFMDDTCHCLDKLDKKENNVMSEQNKKSRMLVVNFFASPGSGKSTGTAYVFSKLKMAGVNAEIASEYVKDKVWEESVEVFKNQAYIFGKQYFRISRVKDKVDVVITDSPILLSCFYNNQPELGEHFDAMCKDVFNSFNNYNIFLNRVKPYNEAGRFQTEAESDALVQPMKDFLAKFGVDYIEYNGCQEDYDKIVDDILYMLGKKEAL